MDRDRVAVLVLLAVGSASVGYGIVHPDTGTVVFGVMDCALVAVLWERKRPDR